MTITVAGRKWKITGACCTMLVHMHDDPKSYFPKVILGCERCETICVDGHRCACCKLPRSARPYGERDHVRVIEGAVFIAKLKAKAA